MKTEYAITQPAGAATTKATANDDLLGMGVVLAVLAALYYSTFEWMVGAWNITDSNYSHGYWVPVVIGYFLWEKRPLFAAFPKYQDNRGLWLIGLGLFMHLAGVLLDVHFLSGLSLMPLFFGLILHYFGRFVAREAFWPTLFIIFMVPLPFVQAALTIKLQLISAQLSAATLNLMGYSTELDGTMMTMPSFQLFVEAPCSGLNTLLSLIFVGSVVAYLAKGHWTRKIILLAAAIPIAVMANMLRIVLIGLLGEHYGIDVAMGVFHNWSGVIMYAVGLTLFLLLAFALRVKFTTPEGAKA